MDQDLMLRYVGRAGGAAAAFYAVGRRMDTVGMLAAVALGWLAGGYLADRFVPVPKV